MPFGELAADQTNSTQLALGNVSDQRSQMFASPAGMKTGTGSASMRSDPTDVLLRSPRCRPAEMAGADCS